MELSLASIIEVVNGVGFPIAMCGALLYMNNNILKKQQESINEMKTIIQGNTSVIAALADHIRGKWNELRL